MSKEKPIIFSTEMVRAIMDGRKTMTRRVVKCQPPEGYRILGRVTSSTDKENEGCACWRSDDDRVSHYCKIPYEVGDILWVRETWLKADDGIYYRADETANSKEAREAYGYKWKPSIHMPHSAARLFIKVKDIRVERLQEITAEDCTCEGITVNQYENEVITFEKLWNRINSKRGYGWNINPWLWVIEFEKVDDHG